MTWFPLGPDFVSVPRDAMAAERLSRRNELPRQTMVHGVVVDPVTPTTIYTVDTPNPVGSGVWRSDDSGQSWTSISDSLAFDDPYFSATSIAVNPVANSYVYLGTQAGAVIVSATSGGSWGAPVVPGGTSPGYQPVYQILVDPRGAGTPATTVLYAATFVGLFRSGDGGATWNPTPVLAGNVTSITAYIPTTGTAHFYASVFQTGVFHTTDPTAGWTLVPNLPAAPGASFASSIVQICANNPNRVYAWFVNQGSPATTYGIYTSATGPTGFAPVAAVNAPPAGTPGLYCFAFAITPNSPGDGANDVLLIASTVPWRSIDGGKNWVAIAEGTHGDTHSFAFQPPSTVLVGNDGGLISSQKYADPTYDVSIAPTSFDDGATYDPNAAAARNLDQNKLAVAVQQYAALPSAAAIGYAACQDTGLCVSRGTLGWRGIADADGRGVACTPGSDGVKVWLNLGSPFYLHLYTDTGGSVPAHDQLVLLDNTPNAYVESFSNHVLDANASCVAGVQLKSTASSFVARIDQTAKAERISQQFGAPHIVRVATSPSDATLMSCVTNDPTGYRLWVTPGGALSSASVWTEPTTNRPAGGGSFGLRIASTAIDPAGNVYALLSDLGYQVGGTPITTPLFQISGSSWIPLPAAGLPSPASGFGVMVADPVQASTLYVVGRLNRVYRVQNTGTTWTWTEISDGLYGTAVLDLWIANIGTASAPKVLLRAALAARGILERDVTANAGDPPARPYVRNHYLDQKWLLPVQSGITDPLEPATQVHHWQCPDIKVDFQQPGTPPFFQTDPEATTVSHVWFDELADNSERLPSMDAAKVHVRVQNRSKTVIDGLHVWAIYANASAGVPALNTDASSGNTFAFWSQFHADGSIVPALPSDSPWHSVGPPEPISGLDVTHPQVVSWDWVVPTLGASDPGHYCMVVFLHGPGYLIGESGLSVDAITQTNPQIGQKNLHVGAALAQARVLERIEFHNPHPKQRSSDLAFDLRALPPQLRLAFELTTSRSEHELHGCERVEGKELLYRARPSSLVEVRGVALGPHARAHATFVIEQHGHLPAGSEYRFDVVQRDRERIVGGSTYVVRIPGRRRLPKPHERPDDEDDGVEIDVLSPALRALAEDRRRFLGRR